jgi:predicted signal transduction protein with EAL and GGDEF domain
MFQLMYKKPPSCEMQYQMQVYMHITLNECLFQYTWLRSQIYISHKIRKAKFIKLFEQTEVPNMVKKRWV